MSVQLSTQTKTEAAPSQPDAEPALRTMLDSLRQGDAIYHPSKMWEALNEKNIRELQTEGLSNLKRTVARNYFTWVIGRKTDQFRFLQERMTMRDWLRVLPAALTPQRDPVFGLRHWNEFRLFTCMLWRFAQSIDAERLLTRIDEPIEGNPFPIHIGGKLASQDLANSVIEYYSMREHFQPPADAGVTICELGAGYGRNAYLFQRAMPRSKYIVIDIPPALYISQTYLSTVLPDRRVFAFRPFDRYSDVEAELKDADIAFLLPHQAAMLPPKSVDLFVNISSLHEMKMEQIRAYFALIDRLTRGCFYTKQHFANVNPHDGICVRHTDYPTPERWQELYLRAARVQVAFFEAMYAIGPGDAA